MRILYAFQGTGNGHLSRARDVIPLVRQFGEVDILVSGTELDLALPWEPTYRLTGISFKYNQSGGLDYWATLQNLNLVQFIRDIYTLDLGKYDLILNDFEPISAWAAKLKKRRIIGLSHQAAFLSKKTPRPAKKDLIAEFLFRYFAPVTVYRAFHFQQYDTHIYPPVIREEVRKLVPISTNRVVVYLPAYADDFLQALFQNFPEFEFTVFSKYAKSVVVNGNISIQPIHNDNYLKMLESCYGLITGGGFEAPAEALYLGKRVLCVPIAGQYEQLANSVAAVRIGATYLVRLDHDKISHIRDWLENSAPHRVEFSQLLPQIVAEICSKKP
jgi:uncharacterized protein (TIGR00661 family)